MPSYNLPVAYDQTVRLCCFNFLCCGSFTTEFPLMIGGFGGASAFHVLVKLSSEWCLPLL